MNLLTEGMNQRVVEETGRKAKVTVDGITQLLPIYRIRLDQLFYNDQNGRIATFISKYKAENKIDSLDHKDREEYNQIIQKFIEDSNPDKMHKTEENIERLGQLVHGIVLKDGRIIDGNRRFTCLRNLYKKKGDNFNWFEAVILDRDYEHDERQIKLLEVQVQIGEESRVDYNPIDTLASIYDNIVKRKIITVEEYSRSAGQPESVTKKQVELAELLEEFLESINAPEEFYIAQDKDLNGPLVELNLILHRISDEELKNKVKNAIFVIFLKQPNKDLTRYVRNLGNAVKKGFAESFLNRIEGVVEETFDQLNRTTVDADVIAAQKADEQSRSVINQAYDNTMDKVKIDSTKDRPMQLLEKALESVRGIDMEIVSMLSESEIGDLASLVEELDSSLQMLRQHLPKED